MSTVEPGSAGAGLVNRVKDILTKPAATWDVIDAERPTVGSLYVGYLIPLAAAAMLANAIGMSFIGVGAFGVSIKVPLLSSLTSAVVSFVLCLGFTFLWALVVDALAPTFGGQKDRIQALKVVAYSSTAGLVAALFTIIPMLGFLVFLGGLYGLYLLYLGLPKLMKTPEDKALPYTATIVGIGIAIGLVCMVLMMALGLAGVGANRLSGADVSGTVQLPGGQGSVDLGKLQAATEKMEAAAEAIKSGEAPPISDPDSLKAYLPASVAGFTRGEVSGSTASAAGIEGAEAEARYSKGDANLRIQIVDMGGAGALAGMAGAFNVKKSKESATGYEKMGVVNGRMTTESYDRTAKRGEYGVLVGERFMVQARGDNVSMDELKAAVEAVGLSRLEAAAKKG